MCVAWETVRFPNVSYLEEASLRREGVHAAVVLGTGEEHGELDPGKRNLKTGNFQAVCRLFSCLVNVE